MERLDSHTAKALQRIAAAANIAPTLKDGQGFSHSVNGKPAPSDGYMVSLPKDQVEQVLPGTTKPSAEQLASYAEQHMKHLSKKDHYIGGWARPDGSYVLEVSRQMHDEEEAHHVARRNKQDALWDYKAAAADPNYSGTDTRKFTPEQEAHIQQFHDNIVHSYHKLDPMDIAAGREWYGEENAKIKDWAQRHGYDHDQALQAFAAMSPRIQWDSVPALMTAIHKKGLKARGALIGNITKAHRILQGESLDDVMRTEAPKVKAFYANLAGHADDAEHVTVDGHAHNIAVDDFKRIGISSAPDLPLARYRMVEEAYKRAAQTTGEQLPHHIQAATWIGYRRLDPKAAAMRADPVEDNAERAAIQNEHEHTSEPAEQDLSHLQDIPF